MRPAKGRKPTSWGEFFFFAGIAKSYAQGLLGQEGQIYFRNSGIECHHDSAVVPSMEAQWHPIAQAEKSRKLPKFFMFLPNFGWKLPNLGAFLKILGKKLPNFGWKLPNFGRKLPNSG